MKEYYDATFADTRGITLREYANLTQLYVRELVRVAEASVANQNLSEEDAKTLKGAECLLDLTEQDLTWPDGQEVFHYNKEPQYTEYVITLGSGRKVVVRSLAFGFLCTRRDFSEEANKAGGIIYFRYWVEESYKKLVAYGLPKRELPKIFADG